MGQIPSARLARVRPLGYTQDMYGYGSAWRASLISLECPHCRTPQLRARLPEGTLYTCTACKRTFKAPPAAKHVKSRKKR